MKHEILEEVWRSRDTISAECGHDLKRLAARVRRLEAQYSDRLAKLPIVRGAKPEAGAATLREEPSPYRAKPGQKSGATTKPKKRSSS